MLLTKYQPYTQNGFELHDVSKQSSIFVFGYAKQQLLLRDE